MSREEPPSIECSLDDIADALWEIKDLLEKLIKTDTISQCPSCLCITKTINNKCGKCRGEKP